jgi:hypothetical protein
VKKYSVFAVLFLATAFCFAQDFRYEIREVKKGVYVAQEYELNRSKSFVLADAARKLNLAEKIYAKFALSQDSVWEIGNEKYRVEYAVFKGEKHQGWLQPILYKKRGAEKDTIDTRGIVLAEKSSIPYGVYGFLGYLTIVLFAGFFAAGIRSSLNPVQRPKEWEKYKISWFNALLPALVGGMALYICAKASESYTEWHLNLFPLILVLISATCIWALGKFSPHSHEEGLNSVGAGFVLGCQSFFLLVDGLKIDGGGTIIANQIMSFPEFLPVAVFLAGVSFLGRISGKKYHERKSMKITYSSGMAIS